MTKSKPGDVVECCGYVLERCGCTTGGDAWLPLAALCECGEYIGDHEPDSSSIEAFRGPPKCPNGSGLARLPTKAPAPAGASVSPNGEARPPENQSPGAQRAAADRR